MEIENQLEYLDIGYAGELDDPCVGVRDLLVHVDGQHEPRVIVDTDPDIETFFLIY